MADSTKTGSDQFGELLRTARERLGMSRRELAVSTGLSYPYISQLETGYRTPSASAMRSLADALGLPPDVMFAAIPHDRGPAPPSLAPEPTQSGAERVPRPRTAPLPTGGSPPADAAAPSPAAAGSKAVAGTAGAGGWFPNPRHVTAGNRIDDDMRSRSAAPAAAPTAAVDAASATVAADAIGASPGAAAHKQAVAEAVRLLTALPHHDRLPAVGEVQARVVQSVVEDRVRQAADGRRD